MRNNSRYGTDFPEEHSEETDTADHNSSSTTHTTAASGSSMEEMSDFDREASTNATSDAARIIQV